MFDRFYELKSNRYFRDDEGIVPYGFVFVRRDDEGIVPYGFCFCAAGR